MAKQSTFDFSQTGPVKSIEFHEIFGQNYGQYGLFVVQDRALPDARDGLKPVQRRILYTLFEGRYLATGPHRKSAEIVGKVLGDRHPHGDGSVYDAMTRMTQAFTLRYPLVDGQGNWGASDGSPAAAYRYTEARLTQLAEELLSDDLKKETVPLLTTYKEDPKVVEPMYLPGHIPPCVNPIDGIAVGISTTVPPHNLGEVLRTAGAMLDAGVLDGRGFSTELLMRHLPGPDFPEGGRLMLANGGVKEYLETGRGRFIMRASVVQEQLTPTKKALVITGLPPVGRDKLITSIIDAINDRKPGTEGLVAEPPLDETNEARTRIVLELKREANPGQVLESLYRHTLLELGVSAQLYFLFASRSGGVATVPRQVGMVELLTYWLHHQLDVLERRLAFELRQYRTRLSTVEALIIGATHAQDLVRIFQEADGKAQAKALIQKKYNLTEAQAEVIATMSLSQVTRPDAGRYLAEKTELLGKIASHEELLASRLKRIALLKQELRDIEKRFGDARRTVIDTAELNASAEVEKGEVATTTNREPLILALYEGGAIKATSPDQFGAKARPHKTDEGLVNLCAVPPDAFVLAGTNLGRIFSLSLEKLPVTTRAGKSENIGRYLKLEAGERVLNLLAVPGAAFGEGGPPLYLVEFSAFGKVKKSSVSEYKSANPAGLSSLKLADGDEVVAVLLSSGQGDYLLTSQIGQTLRFSDDKLNPQGRVGQGQAGIALDKEAKVVSALFWSGGTESGIHFLTLTAKGFIKKTPLTEYPAKGRATGGVVTTLLMPNDSVVATWLVKEDTTLLVATEGGSARLDTSTVPALPRARKGQPVSFSIGTRPSGISPLSV